MVDLLYSRICETMEMFSLIIYPQAHFQLFNVGCMLKAGNIEKLGMGLNH